MRRVLATIATTVVLACGGGDPEPEKDGGPPAALPSGTLGGAAFTPVDAGALVVAPTSCTIGGTTAHASALMIGFFSFGGVCDFVRASRLCDDKASATTVGLLVMKVGLLQSQPPVGPGTYTYVADPAPDASGNLLQVGGDVTRLTATCGSTSADVVAGSVTLTSVGGGRVVGSVDLTFSDGSTFAGPFDVGTCAYRIDLCAMVTGNDCAGVPACIP